MKFSRLVSWLLLGPAAWSLLSASGRAGTAPLNSPWASARSAGHPQANAFAPPANIHPAVVRVVAPGKGSVSYGSGTLVDVKGDFGLVVTNYHVINEATENISVIFPDGFYSLATVRKIDKDWDLAALVIKRPAVSPVPLANAAPRPGEPLTIAGYGAGKYRAASGACTQYVAPGMRMPFEMVELAAKARQGDSGGPIFNQRGELAGVLFGEGGGRTAGSYCGRVKWFLASLTERPDPTAVAAQRAPVTHVPGSPVEVAPPALARRASEGEPLTQRNLHDHFTASTPVTHVPGSPYQATGEPAFASIAPPIRNQKSEISNLPTVSLAPPNEFTTSETAQWTDLAGGPLMEQGKTYLAILGGCALLLHALKLLAAPAASK